MCSPSTAPPSPQLLASSTPSWSRIRISHQDDHEKIYQLLEASYEQPRTLATVKEAVVKLEQIKQMVFFKTFNEHTKPYEEIEQVRDVSPEHGMREVLRLLGLANEDASHRHPDDEIIKHLTWNEPSVRNPRDTRVAADPEKWNVQSYISFNDKHFAHFVAPLLLLHCPNIESLTYSVCPPAYTPDPARGPWRDHILRRTLLRNNYGKLSKTHLQNLRHLRLLPEAGLSWDDGRFYSHMDILGELRLFHRLPAIESIAVDGITINGGADYLEHFPPHTSNIKRIHVGHSMLPSTIIATLIRIPKHLEEFSHSLGGRDSNDGGHYLFSAKTLGKALGDQKTSLRKLDVDVDEMISEDRHDEEDYEDYLETLADPEYGPHWYDEWFYLDEKASTGPMHVYDLPDSRRYDNSIGSLHDFEKLTHLSIGVKLLLGPPHSEITFRLVDGLPKSLEYLLIRGYTKGEVPKYDQAIDELMAERLEKLPALREIHGVEKCIPSAEVEQSPRTWHQPTAEEEAAIEYWELDEGDQEWLAA